MKGFSMEEKISLINKLIHVILSCKSNEQLIVAIKYMNLVRKRVGPVWYDSNIRLIIYYYIFFARNKFVNV